MFRRVLQCIILALGISAGAMAKESGENWIRGIYTGASPRPVAVAAPEAWQKASRVADHTPGAFVLMGSGHSMQPLYTPGTVMVLQKVSFGELKRGQTVLYRSKENRIVAHVLIAKARDGWRARGLNNRIHDMEPVQEKNLVGVVIAAFQPVTRRPATVVATVGQASSPILN